jgi:hypothetical protein
MLAARCSLLGQVRVGCGRMRYRSNPAEGRSSLEVAGNNNKIFFMKCQCDKEPNLVLVPSRKQIPGRWFERWPTRFVE